jgi:hypothetical protein
MERDLFFAVTEIMAAQGIQIFLLLIGLNKINRQ